jgi:hypothetical protein
MHKQMRTNKTIFQTGSTGSSGYFIFVFPACPVESGKESPKLNPINPVDPV